MNLTKYILISLLIHVLAFSALSWQRVPSVSLGMDRGGISLSFQKVPGGDGIKQNQSYGSSDGPGLNKKNSADRGGGESGAIIASKAVEDAYKNNPPLYPRIARVMGYQGSVILELEVLPNGTCGSAIVSRSSGYSVLDKSALNAAKSWVFFKEKDLLLSSPVKINQEIVFILQKH